MQIEKKKLKTKKNENNHYFGIYFNDIKSNIVK